MSNGAITGHVETARSIADTAGRLGDALEAKRPIGHFGTVFVTIDDVDFKPKSAKTLPRLMAERLPHRLARDLALELNQEAIDSRRGRWHFLVRSPCDWYGVLRMRFDPRDLPASPESYELDVYNSLSCSGQAALKAAEVDNEAICRVARIPRLWHVAVRELRDDPADG